MLGALAERPLLARLLACVPVLLALGALALPAVDVTVDERRARASALELARDDATVTGFYVHAAYEGEAEALVHDARGTARAALAALAAALLLVWLPGRTGFTAGAAFALLAVVALLLLHQSVTSSFDLVDGRLRVGYALALFAAALAVAWCALAASRALFWWRPKPPPARDYFPEKT